MSRVRLGPGAQALLLLLPLPLSQVVLQGGFRFLQPQLRAIAEHAYVHPDHSEFDYLVITVGLVIGCELVVLMAGLVWWGICAEDSVRASGTLHLVRSGLVTGVPFSLFTYFIMWWTDTVPENMPYNGLVGHPLPYFIYIACLVGTFGALCEEIYFRRALQTFLTSMTSARLGIGLNVTAFALWHPNAYENPGHMFAIVSGGILYSILYARHGSIIPGTICHAMLNVFAVLIANTNL